MAAFTTANTVTTAALIYADPLYNKLPYHTSALSGADWVPELLTGHPEQIRNELGVHKHVFRGLIDELKLAGYGPSKYVYLEEQLSIFLYTCTTGLIMSVNISNTHVKLYQSTLSFYINLKRMN